MEIPIKGELVHERAYSTQQSLYRLGLRPFVERGEYTLKIKAQGFREMIIGPVVLRR